MTRAPLGFSASSIVIAISAVLVDLKATASITWRQSSHALVVTVPTAAWSGSAN